MSRILGRRLFLKRCAGAASVTLLADAGRAAPFVPVRDPQVVAFAPGGTLVATGCSGMTDGHFPPRPHPDVRKCGVVAVWDIETRKRLFRWETFGDLTKLAFSPNGTLLASCRLFAAADGVALDEVRVFDITSGRVAKVLDRCHAFDFSPDGRQLVVLSRSRCAVYDVKDWNKERHIEPLGGAVGVAFSADGLSLVGVVTGEGKYRLRLVQLERGEAVAESLALAEPFYRVAVAADGSLLATGHDAGQVVLWDAATLAVRTRLQTGERGLAHPFFSPDARLLAAGCQENGDVVIWNLADRQEVGRHTFAKGSFRPHYSRAATAVFRPERDPARFSFSPGGDTFLAGCYGGIVRAVTGGQEVARFGE
jgi:WD40 repeat protein